MKQDTFVDYAVRLSFNFGSALFELPLLGLFCSKVSKPQLLYQMEIQDNLAYQCCVAATCQSHRNVTLLYI